MGQAERVARLLECWRVLCLQFEQAERWRQPTSGIVTALKIIDACIAIEDSTFAERDKYGNITSDPDQLVLARLREIAIVRDLTGERAAAEAKAKTVETPA